MDLKTFIKKVDVILEQGGQGQVTPPPPKIKALIQYLIPRDPLFATFLLRARYIKNRPDVNTAAVNIRNGKINFYYNEEFINKFPPEELMFIIAHEFYHIVRLHLDRAARRRMEPHLYNAAADMIINESILRDLKQVAGLRLKMPRENGKEIGLKIPPAFEKKFPEYKKWTTEKLYKYLEKKGLPKSGVGKPPSKKDLLKPGAVVRVNKTGQLGVIEKINKDGTYEVKPITEKQARKILGLD